MGINENLQPVTWAVSIPFIVITCLTCILRVYSRLCLSNSFGIDDWFMVAASVRTLPFGCICISNSIRLHGSLIKGSLDK
jgi:hypothetical protein